MGRPCALAVRAPESLVAEGQTVIQSKADFTGATGTQKRWTTEIKSAKDNVKAWHDRAKRIVDRFLDKREDRQNGDTRLNLFSANIQTRRSMMYGRTPRADVSRRFEDSSDAVARVAAQILSRLLNMDIEADADNYATAIGLSLDDHQLVGLGQARIRYEAEFEPQEPVAAQIDEMGAELAPAYTPPDAKVHEDVPVDYVHYKDFLWSPARVWSEVRWVAFKTYLTKDQLEERFGKEKAQGIAVSSRKSDDREDGLKHDPWERAEVWEVWSKDDQKVYWYAEGAKDILDEKEDPLQLKGFFPCPRPLVANVTTDSFMPVPEFVLGQDIYDEIDAVSTRITMLERAIKVVGVYDATSDGVQRMLQEGCDNELIPVSGWNMHVEKGGIKGVMDFLPLEPTVMALTRLREYRTELISLLYEVTGMSDIMRGSSNAAETATAQALKAKFASVRMQSAQDEFARFATELLRLKAEVIISLCDDQFILDGSNILNTPDAQIAPEALELLKSDASKFRIEVKPENISIADHAQIQSERTQVLQGMTTFLQASIPLMQANPAAAPYLLEMLKWALSGFRGASTIEGVLDQAILAAKQELAKPPQPPPPDPKIEAQKQKAQLDVGVAKTKAGIEITKLQQKNQIDQQKMQIDQQKANMQMQNFAQQTRLEAERAVLGADAPEAQRPGRRD
jgi:hypothetical protein